MARKLSLGSLFTSYGLIAFLVMITAALVLVHAGRLLNFGFPIMATVIAGILFVTSRSAYTAFVWWIWLFSPLVRRLVDYQSSYHTISPVIATPLLVTSVALVAILLRPWVILHRSLMPVLLVLIALLIALAVGIGTSGALPAIYDFDGWLSAIGLAVFLMMYPDDYEEMRSALVFAIISGLALTAGYGLYQFYHIPPWDAYWINASQFTTAGLAQDQQVRLFGTLNSPGPYAIVLMVSLVFVLISSGWLRLVAGGLGIAAFGLTEVRSAWGAFALAALYVVWRVGGKTRLRMILAGALIAAIAVPLLSAGPVADAVSARFATLSNIQQDSSYQARTSLFESTYQLAFSQPIGTGLGNLGTATKLANGQVAVFDSGILQIASQFGWVGGALFVWGIVSLTLRVLAATRGSDDRIAIAGAGMYFANLSLNLSAIDFGIYFWVGLAMALGPLRAPVLVTGTALGRTKIAEEQTV